MLGWVLIAGFILSSLNVLLICGDYDERNGKKFPVVAFFVSLIIFCISLVLFKCGEGIWKIIAVLGMLNFGAIVVALLIFLIITELLKFKVKTSAGIYFVIYMIALVAVLISNLSDVPAPNLATESPFVYYNPANIVAVETPLVQEKHYELLNASDINSMNNDEPDMLMYVPSANGNYYLFYYAAQNEEGEIIARPFKIFEDEVEVIIESNGVEEATSDYLVETTIQYYNENRNKKPAEKLIYLTEKEYKLYLRDVTFKNMIIVGSSK